MNIKSSLLFISIYTYIFSLINAQRNRGREHSSNDFLNLQVNRTIDLSASIIRIQSEILIKSNNVQPIYSYRVPILKNSSKYMINLSAKLRSSLDEVISLKVSKQNSQGDSLFDYYEISFKSDPMNFEEERTLVLTEDYFERLQMLPKKIIVKEDQLVVFEDTVNQVSFYQTNSQKTKIILPRERTELIDYTKKDANRKKDILLYEVKNSFVPLQMEPLRLHYDNNKPITVFNYAHRTYEVSHWGNIAVEDRYQIENIGAKLEGEFGRVDYDHGNGGKNALTRLKARLPIKSFGLWYRDEIGNVSTSRAAREWDDVRLDLTPRFPILGGWKSNFNIGFNLPSKFHVSTDGNDLYTLNVTYGLPYADSLAKNYSVRIVLPEGAHDIKLNLPIESKYQVTKEKSHSYLDMFGRPTLVISMPNCYDLHKVNFTIQYKYSQFNLYFKPLLVVLFFFSIFMMLIVYFRIDLSLSRTTDEEKKNK